MTQKEFESLTGENITAERYDDVELVYLSTDMDKDLFCDMWNESSDMSRDYMIMMAKKHRVDIEALKSGVKHLANSNNALLEVMFDRAQKMSDPVLREECIKHMGEKEYLSKMIKEERTLWMEDKEMLMDILTRQ